jgi:hypothetical protein
VTVPAVVLFSINATTSVSPAFTAALVLTVNDVDVDDERAEATRPTYVIPPAAVPEAARPSDNSPTATAARTSIVFRRKPTYLPFAARKPPPHGQY